MDVSTGIINDIFEDNEAIDIPSLCVVIAIMLNIITKKIPRKIVENKK